MSGLVFTVDVPVMPSMGRSPTIGFEGTNILHLVVLAFVQVLVELGS